MAESGLRMLAHDCEGSPSHFALRSDSLCYSESLAPESPPAKARKGPICLLNQTPETSLNSTSDGKPEDIDEASICPIDDTVSEMFHSIADSEDTTAYVFHSTTPSPRPSEVHGIDADTVTQLPPPVFTGLPLCSTTPKLLAPSCDQDARGQCIAISLDCRPALQNLQESMAHETSSNSSSCSESTHSSGRRIGLTRQSIKLREMARDEEALDSTITLGHTWEQPTCTEDNPSDPTGDDLVRRTSLMSMGRRKSFERIRQHAVPFKERDVSSTSTPSSASGTPSQSPALPSQSPVPASASPVAQSLMPDMLGRRHSDPVENKDDHEFEDAHEHPVQVRPVRRGSAEWVRGHMVPFKSLSEAPLPVENASQHLRPSLGKEETISEDVAAGAGSFKAPPAQTSGAHDRLSGFPVPAVLEEEGNPDHGHSHLKLEGEEVPQRCQSAPVGTLSTSIDKHSSEFEDTEQRLKTSEERMMFAHLDTVTEGEELSRAFSTPAGLDYARVQRSPQSQPSPLLRSVTQQLVHALNSGFIYKHPETTPCCICFDNIPTESIVILQACRRQAHGACEGCISHWFGTMIKDSRVGNLCCPKAAGEDACDAVATEAELERLLDGDMMSRYHRFVTQHEQPNLRECFRCGEKNLPIVDRAAGKEVIKAEMCCKCGAEYCFFHSNAHAPGREACIKYDRVRIKEERENMAQIGAKLCPQCDQATVKNEGCNHMSCPCGCQWCWVCGRSIGSAAGIGWHYNPVNPMGCLQFQDTKIQGGQRRSTSLRCMDFLSRVFAFPGAIVTMLIAVCAATVGMVSALVFGLVFGIPCELCFLRRRRTTEYRCGVQMKCAATFGWLGAIIPLWIPFGLFCIAWGVAAVPLYLIMWPCGGTRGHFFVIATSPLSTVAALSECFGHNGEPAAATREGEKPAKPVAAAVVNHGEPVAASGPPRTALQPLAVLQGQPAAFIQPLAPHGQLEPLALRGPDERSQDASGSWV